MIKETLLKLFRLDGLVNNLTGYVETRVELMKYEVKEDLARVFAKLAVIVFMLATGLLFVLFISTAIAFSLAAELGAFGGFAIVAGFYLLVTLLCILLRDKIRLAIEKQLKEIINNK